MHPVFVVFVNPFCEFMFSVFGAKEPFFAIEFNIEGSPHSFGLAVCLRTIRPCVFVLDAE